MSYSIIFKAPELGTKIIGPLSQPYANARDAGIREWNSHYSSFPDCTMSVIRDEDGKEFFKMHNIGKEI